jgi:hypothetical protein
VWGRLHRIPLARLGKADEIDWERASVLEAAVDAISPILKTSRGQTRKRPRKLHADKAYVFPRCCEL